MRRLSTLLAPLLAATALATPAQAAPTPPPTATPNIIGGAPAYYTPFAVRLFRDGAPWCSATIIAPTWVLTAQHCVSDRAATYTFRIGSDWQDAGGVLVTGVEITAHPDADLALARIDQAQPSWWEYARLGEPGAVAADQDARIWGWGATCTGNEIACQSPVLKVATTRVVTLDSVDYLGGSAILAGAVDGIAAGGDSGGPMTAISPVDGTQYQVGVSSTSNRSTWCAYTNVTLYRDWIRAVAGV